MKFKKGDRAKQIRFVSSDEKSPYVTVTKVTGYSAIHHKHDGVKYNHPKQCGCCSPEDLVLIKKGERKMEKKKFYGHPDFYKLLEEIKDLHSRKNFNYAKTGSPLSNFYACERFGLPAPWGCMTRMTDKDDRKIQVLLKGDVVGEDITQTSRDDAVYNLLFEILWKDFLKNKNAKKIISMFREIKELLDSGK